MQINGVSYNGIWRKAINAAKDKSVSSCTRRFEVAREVVAFFDAHGWPDNWHAWKRKLADGVDWRIAVRVEDIFEDR